jgi:phosphoserine phosphatase
LARKIISFDFDGVIVTQMNSWGLIREIKGIPEGRLDEYAKRLINGKEFRDTEHLLFREYNLGYDDFIQAGNQEEFHPNVYESIIALYQRGHILCINSAGPRPTILTVLRRFEPQPFKYVYSMIPLFDINNIFYDTYLPFEDDNRDVDKVRVMQEIAQKEEVPLESLVHLGDGASDLPCFERCIGISFNSHNPKVIQSAQYNITDFNELIPLIDSLDP